MRLDCLAAATAVAVAAAAAAAAAELAATGEVVRQAALWAVQVAS